VVHVFPHWNWAGKEGQNIDVWAHSNAAKIELFLNGQSLGVKDMPQYRHVQWSVPYAPGKLEARGYDADGKVIASDAVETTGEPTALKLTTDRTSLNADGEDVTMIEVAVVDAQGRVVPTADNNVSFDLAGPGQVAGVGNGDPSSHDPDKATQRHAFNGLCLAVVQAGDRMGTLKLTASSPGLKSAEIEVAVAPGAAGSVLELK
jgi:beta-galactosidase